MSHWNNRPLNGCLFEEPIVSSPMLFGDNQDHLPRKIDLRSGCSPVEDQGPTNSCTANAIVGAMEYLQRQSGLPQADLSRMFVELDIVVHKRVG